MSVRVVAKTHPLRNKLEHWEELAGTKLTEILKKISRMFRHLPITVQVNGKPINKAKWNDFHTLDGDLVNICVTPASGKAGLSVLGAGIGIGGLLLARMLSKKSADNAASTPATSSNGIGSAPDPAPDPTPQPVDNFGGYKDAIMPTLTGVSNQSAPYEAITRVYGTYRINPVSVAEPYYVTQGNSQYLYAVFSCGYGKLDISDIKIGQIPIGDYVSQGVLTYEVLTGASPDSEAVTIYTNDHTTTNVGSELVYNVAQRIVANQQADTLSVDITFPSGLYAVDNPTKTLHSNTTSITIVGDMPATEYAGNVSTTCEFTIRYRLYTPDGSGSWTTRSVSATANQPGSHRISDTWSVTRGLYEVEVKKTTSSSAVVYDQEIPPVQLTPSQTQLGFTLHHNQTPVNTAVFGNLKAIKNSAPINKLKDKNGDTIPLTYIAVKVKASALLNGTLDNLSCLCKSYLRKWNGTSWDAPVISNNPAWVLADILTGTANNKQLDDSYLDKDQLKAWADFCDEKQLYFNDAIDSFTTLPEILKRVVSCGRASFNVVDGLISVVYDDVKTTAVAMFTPANSYGLRKTRAFPQQPHAIRVNFINPDADWQQDQRIVYADGYTAANATIYETLDYRGVTNSAQAYKLARYHMAAALLRPVKFSLNVDWINLVCNRGDLVYLNYDVALYGIDSALIDQVIDDGDFVTSLRLNQQVYFDTTKTYGIKIWHSDGSIVRYLLESDSGWTDTVTLANPIDLGDTPLPVRNNTVAFGFYNDEAQPMLVEEIRHNASDRSATLTLVDYSPGIFTADTETIPAYSPTISIQHPARATLETPVIQSLKSDESVLIRSATGALISQIQINLQQPLTSVPLTIKSQYKLSTETQWLSNNFAAVPGATTTYISNVVDGAVYDVRVQYVNAAGITSEWATSLNHTVIGKTTPPPDVISFRLQGLHALIDFLTQGGVAVPLDFAGYEVRWALGSIPVPWENMLVLVELSTAPSIDISKLPKGALVLAVKAVDTAGNRSDNACYLYRNITNEYLQNIIDEYDFGPTWSGTKTNATVSGNDLLADANTDLFYDSPNFYDPDPDSVFYDPGYLSMQYEDTVLLPPIDPAKPYNVFCNFEGLVESDYSFVQYKLDNQTQFYDSSTAPMYGAGSDLFYDTLEGTWTPFPQEGLAGTRQPLDIRISAITTTAMRPALRNGVSLIYDLPDLEEEVDQVIAANGGDGTALTLTKTYTEIRQVQLTIQHNALYPTVVSASVDKTVMPPVVRCYDNGGNVIDGEVLAIVRGY